MVIHSMPRESLSCHVGDFSFDKNCLLKMVVVHGYGTNYQRIDPALTCGWKITSVILGNGRFTDSLQILIPSWDFTPGNSKLRSECSILDDEQ